MSALANYSHDQAFTQQARKLLDRDLYPRLAYQGRFVAIGGNSAGAMFLQRTAHIDVVLQRTDSEARTVEEKIVRRWYNAIVVETHSNLERALTSGKPDGWIHTSTADGLIYAFGLASGLEVWAFSLPGLRQWFLPRELKLPLSDTPNGIGGVLKYHTRNRVVPIEDIPIPIKHRFLLKW